MKCLLSKHQSFNYYLNYIEYLQTPTSYDSTYYPYFVSPFISVNIYNSIGAIVPINDCTGENQIKFYLPFYSYNWLNYINEQKRLFLPENYKLPNDPVFKDPIYIDKNGYVSDDTVEKRIEEYYRYYNIVGIYYTPKETTQKYSQKNINFIEYTNLTNYIYFHSTHLTSFTSMLIDNVMEFDVDGRFFYLKKMQLFKYKGNYKSPGFIFIMIILFLFIFACVVYYFYDYSYYEKEELLDFLKKEIIKVHFPYDQIDFGDNNKNLDDLIPHYQPDYNRRKDLKYMFDDKFTEKKNLNEEKIEEKENKDDILNLNDLNTISNPPKKNFFGDKLNDDDNNNDEKNTNKTKKSVREIYKNKNKDNISNQFTMKEENVNVEETKNVISFNKKKKKKSIKKNNNNNNKNNFYIETEAKENLNVLQTYENTNENQIENDLPEDIENEKELKKKAIENYSNLNCTTSHFIKWNINKRHILLGPILNRSIFNHRWKKFFVLTTQIYTNMCLISLILTNDENINSKNKGKIILTSILTEFVSNLLVYLYEWLFITSTYQRTRMFHLVMKGRQLHIIKAWNRLKKTNVIKTIFGVIFCLILWVVNFYITFGFLAVWKNQRNAWIIIFILSEIIDLVFCEIIMEIIVGLFFYKRKSYMSVRDFGEWLNRFRGYRTLYP